MYDIADFWGSIRLCFDEVLPDQLEQEGISWKYYASENAWMNVLQMIRHVRYGPMWKKVQPPETFVKDVKQGEMPAVSWVIPPESYNEHPGGGRAPAPGRTGPCNNTIMRSEYWRSTAIVVVWDDFGGFLRPGGAAAVRRHGPRAADARTDHQPVREPGLEPRRRLRGPHDLRVLLGAAFIELFGLDPMTDRDAEADPLSGAFDFANPNFDKLVLPLRDDCPYGTSASQFPRPGRSCGRSASPATSRRGTAAEQSVRSGSGSAARGPARSRTPRAGASRPGMRELGEPPVVLDEPQHAGELSQLVGHEPLLRVGADHQQRDPDPEAEVVDLRRGTWS